MFEIVHYEASPDWCEHSIRVTATQIRSLFQCNNFRRIEVYHDDMVSYFRSWIQLSEFESNWDILWYEISSEDWDDIERELSPNRFSDINWRKTGF